MKKFVRNAVIAFSLALLAIVPARAQFADQSTYVAAAGGSASAITAALPNVSALGDVLGVAVKIKASNTFAAGATLSISGTTALPIKRAIPSGLINNLAGDVVVGQVFTVVSDGTQYQLVSAPAPKAPTVQVLTGSGTYTPPLGVIGINVQMVGGGGGGGGGGLSSGAGSAGVGTSFGGITANPGQPGAQNVASQTTAVAGGAGGTGGSGTTGVVRRVDGSPGLPGGPTNGSSYTNTTSSPGGPSCLTPFGNGGYGGAMQAIGAPSQGGAGGGGAGECVEIQLSSPSPAAYSVGTGGTVGSTGSQGTAGTNGGDGTIIVQEFYN